MVRKPKRPTVFPPGSKEKIAIMRKRRARGEELFHPGDKENVVILISKLRGRRKE